MSRKQGDLLQILMERQKKERTSEKPDSPSAPQKAPEPAPQPPKHVMVTPPRPDRPRGSIVDVLHKKEAAMPRVPSPSKPVREYPLPKPSGDRVPFEPRMVLLLLGTAGALICLSFFLGWWMGEKNRPAGQEANFPPPHSSFTWEDGFTVEAVSLDLASGIRQELIRTAQNYSSYLSSLGLVVEGRLVDNHAVLFVGRADGAGEESLVSLQTWIRSLPGPQGEGRPFGNAKIRSIPRPAENPR